MDVQTLFVDQIEQLVSVFGNVDENIKLIEHAYQVQILNRENTIKILGEPGHAALAKKVLEEMLRQAARGESLNVQRIKYIIDMVDQGLEEHLPELETTCVCISAKGHPVRAKTFGQKDFIESVAGHTICFGVGPAGTGKTYLAVAMAVKAYRSREVSKIVLTRPVVEAGEKLGFLPGDLQDKIDPYLRPLYDALFDLFGAETFQKYVERGDIEIAPLAYMRGRTLNDSFVILDEAQNTSPEQMKMFLTRLGKNSKMVINGDATQVDLPRDKHSGLKDALERFRGMKDIGIVYLNKKDIVRNPLVQEIVEAYEK